MARSAPEQRHVRPAPEPRPRLTLRLSSFLSLITRDVGDQLRSLDGHRHRDFDFYAPFRDALRAYAIEGLGRGEALEGIEATSTQSMLRRNGEVFERVADWLDRQGGRMVPPPSGVWRAPGGALEIEVAPEIAIEGRHGRLDVIAVYGREAPRLRRDQAGAVARIMGETFADIDGATFGVLDAEAGQVLRTPTAFSDRVLEAELRVITEELGAKARRM
ncbi:hypothetical protein [Jannaschia sp. W003]|uniref:hypothetical protein n=1 Tax=Jannaschia sp. W003 TaxID=2867012 RepID=UPI0021A3758E|nr:hypothetical protein [Jannaschia sp. W003]UWQ21173.1 hypothetical protein K3554_14540 [Jannaschia sp. W003]